MDGKDRNLPSLIQTLPLDRSLTGAGKDILGKSPTGLDLGLSDLFFQMTKSQFIPLIVPPQI